MQALAQFCDAAAEFLFEFCKAGEAKVAWDGSGYVTSFSVSAAVEDNTTYSVEITVSGAISLVTES